MSRSFRPRGALTRAAARSRIAALESVTRDPMTARPAAGALRAFASTALQRAGMEPAKATAVADVLVEGDLLGHTTHGLQLLPLYLAEIEQQQMTLSGEPTVLADHEAAVTWDGRRLPGPWLTLEAIALASGRARSLGCFAVAIRRSHHI